MSESISARLLDLSDDVRKALHLSRLVGMVAKHPGGDAEKHALAMLGMTIEEKIEAIESTLDGIISDTDERA